MIGMARRARSQSNDPQDQANHNDRSHIVAYKFPAAPAAIPQSEIFLDDGNVRQFNDQGKWRSRPG